MSDNLLKEWKFEQFLKSFNVTSKSDYLLYLEVKFKLGLYHEILEKFQDLDISSYTEDEYYELQIFKLRFYFRIAFFDDAIDIVNELMSKKIVINKDSTKYKEIKIYEAMIYLRRFRIDKVKKLYNEIEHFELEDEPFLKFFYLFLSGQLNRYTKQLDKVENFHLQSLDIATELNDPDLMLVGNFNLMNYYMSIDEYNKVESKAEESFEILKRFSNPFHEGLVNNILGILNAITENSDKVINHFDKAVEKLKPLPDKLLLNAIYNNYATFYQRNGDYEKALELYFDILELHKDLEYHFGLSLCYYNISNVFYKTGYYESALDYQLKALEIKEDPRYEYELLNDYTFIILILIELNKLNEAFDYLEKSLSFAKELREPRRKASIHFIAGHLHMKVGKLREAEDHFLVSLEIRENLKQVKELAESYIALGELYFYKYQLDEATKYFEIGIEHAGKIDNEKFYAELLLKYIQFQNELGNLKIASEKLAKIKEINLSKENYRIKGDILLAEAWNELYELNYNESIQLISEAIEFYKILDNIDQIARSYNMLGMVFETLDQNENALSSRETALDYQRKVGNKALIGYTIFSICILKLKMNLVHDQYFDELTELKNSTSIEQIEIYHVLIIAVNSIKSQRLIELARAQEQLKSLLNPQLLIFLKILVYEQLLEVLFFEYEMTRKEEVEREIVQIFNDYYSFGVKSEVQIVVIHALFFKIRFDEIKGVSGVIDPYKKQLKAILDENDLFYFKDRFNDLLNSQNQKNQLNDPNRSIKNISENLKKFNKNLNQMLHSTPRLIILFYLLTRTKANFNELRQITGLTPGNLGRHCDKLAEVELLEKFKAIDPEDNAFKTYYRLTPQGMSEFRQYKEDMSNFLTLNQY